MRKHYTKADMLILDAKGWHLNGEPITDPLLLVR